MAKLLKHLGIGVKKNSSPSAGGTSSHRNTVSSSSSNSSSQRAAADADYCNNSSTSKSTSVQELQPKSPTRYRSSGSLSSNASHDYDTQSLKSFFDGQPRSTRSHDPRSPPGGSQHGIPGSGHHAGGRGIHRGASGADRSGGLSPKGCVGGSDGHYPAAYGTSVMSVTEEGEVFDSSPVSVTSRVPELAALTTDKATATPVFIFLYFLYGAIDMAA